MLITETSRLELREFEDNDAQNLFLLNSDPEVIKYTGDKPFETVGAAKLFLKSYDQYQKYGLGRWAVTNKINREFLGWCGLKYNEDLKLVDLGFRLFKKYWNRGYATEASAACLQTGFLKLELDKIIGRTMKMNQASARVLIKLGFKYEKVIDYAEHEGCQYSISKTEWHNFNGSVK